LLECGKASNMCSSGRAVNREGRVRSHHECNLRMRRGYHAIGFTMLLTIVAAFPARGAVGAGTEGIGVWDPDGLVAQIRAMPPILAPRMGGGICAERGPCDEPPVPPVEAKRKQVYDELYSFGASIVPALARLLQSDDVTSKRNALLALDVLGGGWYFVNRKPSRVDISAALPALVAALGDSDATVRGWAAQSFAYVGPFAAQFVPQLEALLNDPDEGVRNSACIGLRGIGPAAS
jgi:hypothetical protein